MSETLQLPALQVQAPCEVNQDGSASGGNPTSPSPSLRRKRFKMRRMRHVQSEREPTLEGSKEYLQLPSIEITPSSDEDAVGSGSSTPSASPCRRRSLLRKWLRGGDKKEQSSESRSVWLRQLHLIPPSFPAAQVESTLPVYTLYVDTALNTENHITST